MEELHRLPGGEAVVGRRLRVQRLAVGIDQEPFKPVVGVAKLDAEAQRRLARRDVELVSELLALVARGRAAGERAGECPARRADRDQSADDDRDAPVVVTAGAQVQLEALVPGTGGG